MYSITLINLSDMSSITLPPISLPEEMEESVKQTHTTENVLNIGEILIPGKVSLREWSFTINLSPDSPDPPAYYLSWLRAAMESEQRLRLMILRTDMSGAQILDTNCDVLIMELRQKESGGLVGWFEVALKLKEFRVFGAGAIVKKVSKRTNATKIGTGVGVSDKI